MHANTSKHKVEPQATVDPDEVIPLDYAPITPPRTSTRSHGTTSTNQDGRISPNQLLVFSGSSLPGGTWHTLSKTLLLRKAVVAYYGLADSKMALHKYGLVLKYVRLALLCFGKWPNFTTL